MSTSTARQVRGKSALPRYESAGEESHVEGRTTRSMSKIAETRTQKPANKKKVQMPTKPKKMQMPTKPKKEHNSSKKSRAGLTSPPRTKLPKSEVKIPKLAAKKADFLTSERDSIEPKDDIIDKFSEQKKDSWGDTIFKENEPNSYEEAKKVKIYPKRKSQSTSQGDLFELELSQAKTKKSKQTKDSAEKSPENIASKTKINKSASKTRSQKPSDSDTYTKTIIQLDIALAEVDIPITRRILVSNEINIARLARIIVASMGWKGYYDWKIVIQGTEVFSPDASAAAEGKAIADEVFLDDYSLQIGQSFEFLYNLGCNWRHVIRVIDVKEMPTKGQYERGNATFNPVIIDGKNACPSDEIEGGAKEYNQMLDILKIETPKTTYEEIIEIYGRDFDPYEFRTKTVNNLLKNFPYDEEFDTTKCEHDHIFKW